MRQTKAATIRLRRAAQLVGISDTTLYTIKKSGFLMKDVPIFEIGGISYVGRAALERAVGAPLPDEDDEGATS